MNLKLLYYSTLIKPQHQVKHDKIRYTHSVFKLILFQTIIKQKYEIITVNKRLTEVGVW